MVLSKKRGNELIPQYSLTGDLLSYLRCGLQYRYHNGSSLPPSRPVQLWFGEFIHGVMEAAYRIWSTTNPAFPWPSNPTPYRQAPPKGRSAHDIGVIGDVVEGTLMAQGKSARSRDTRDNAYVRAQKAVNELGPHLFPLIASAEERVIGTRTIPNSSANASRSQLYELHGIIDVVTDVQLSGATTKNVIKQAIQDSCPGLSGNYEVIVDYKGSRRPATSEPYWQQGEWQVQTYGWLRTRQANSLPVAAGVLLYVNELSPVSSDLVSLRREVSNNKTDVIPANGTPDSYALNAWRTGNAIPNFSLAFRLARAIRVIPIDPTSQATATNNFDKVVASIEQCVAQEAVAGAINPNWAPCGDEETCAACDFRHFCPSPYPHKKGHVVGAPSAP
ncbi:MAG: PD-(D/E)XK nuclease family protein [Planctomycetaceae bacterium]|nr:PD-(D/E)XK nuclease family protein [Planctomycetaceae bacterium]